MVLQEVNKENIHGKLGWLFLIKFICLGKIEVLLFKLLYQEWTNKIKWEWLGCQQLWQMALTLLNGLALINMDSSILDQQFDQFLYKYISKVSVKNIIVQEWQLWISQPTIISKNSAMENQLSYLSHHVVKLAWQLMI